MPRHLAYFFAPTLTLLSACGGGDPPQDAGTDSSSESETGEPVLESLSLSIRDNPNSTINPFADLELVGSDLEVGQFSVEVFEAGESLGPRRVYDMDGTFSAFLWGLHGDTTYSARATYEGPAGSVESEWVEFTTGPLPEDVPQIEVLVHDETRAHTGLVIIPIKMDGNQAYLGIDPGGEIAWYYRNQYELGNPGGDLKVTLDGKFHIFRPGGIQIIEPWGEVLLDQALEFHHEVTPMPNGDQLTLINREVTMDVDQFGGEVQVLVDGILQVAPDGNIVKEWWSPEHIDHQSWPSGLGLQEQPYDWTHSNAIVWLEDSQQLMVSMRHQLGVFMIDWETGELLWELGPTGDFTLINGDENDWFYNQHSPQLQPDGTWLIYDNGNERPNQGMYSRAVRMALDHDAMTAEVVWEHVIPTGTPVQGDADRLHNGNILSCAGGVLNTGNLPRLVEATNDDASEVVWEVLVDGEGASNLYRATEIHDMNAPEPSY